MIIDNPVCPDYATDCRQSNLPAAGENLHLLCNRPWVMRQHRTHVSSITGLMYYCARLGLSSTAISNVSYLFHPHHAPLMNCRYIYRSSLRAASLYCILLWLHV
jgi:hypothetical protein